MTRYSSKKYWLFREIPTGEVKSWSMPMRLIDVRRMVFYCLTDNGLAESDDAKVTSELLEDNPHTTVSCGGYRFWVVAASTATKARTTPTA